MQPDRYVLITIAILSGVTILLRALPFLLFPAGRQTPRVILYLGRVLPSALIGMLVVYCLKSVQLSSFPFGLPELIAIAAVIALHVWKRNSLLSIGGGTLLYMLLVQLVFA